MSNLRLAVLSILPLTLAGASFVFAQATPGTIKLAPPARMGGLTIMEALAVRASVREWSSREIAAQELSDLLWAANGVNRPDGKRTAASAMNAQDVDVYVVMKDRAYVYDAAAHALTLVSGGDRRSGTRDTSTRSSANGTSRRPTPWRMRARPSSRTST